MYSHCAQVLAKFPTWMAPWKKGIRRSRGRGFFYALAEEAAGNSEQSQCYSKKLFDEAPKYNLNDYEVASLAGNLFGAGSDTSSSTLITFLLACCAFPESLPPAWEELDRVVGHHRNPTFDDEPNLPYVTALVKEVFRWRSVAIIGGQPHAPTQDEYYKVRDSLTTKLTLRTITRYSPKQPGLPHPQILLGPRQRLGNPPSRTRVPKPRHIQSAALPG